MKTTPCALCFSWVPRTQYLKDRGWLCPKCLEKYGVELYHEFDYLYPDNCLERTKM